MTTSVRLSDVVASVFAGVWRSIKAHEFTHYWFKGGRNSTKSSFISIAIVLLIMLNPEANAVVLRKVGNTLRTSVYEQIGWACDVLGVAHLFDFGLSPMEVTYRPTGQVIRFLGCDKPKKLKSAKFRTGYCAVVWFEEVDEFDGMDEVRSVLATFLRGGDMFWVFYSYNPPRSARNWVNKEARDLEAHPGEDGRFICHTTYLDVIDEHPEWISATPTSCWTYAPSPRRSARPSPCARSAWTRAACTPGCSWRRATTRTSACCTCWTRRAAREPRPSTSRPPSWWRPSCPSMFSGN